MRNGTQALNRPENHAVICIQAADDRKGGVVGLVASFGAADGPPQFGKSPGSTRIGQS